MTTFRTTFPIKESEHKIDYNSNILLAGSCFTENIGKKLHFHKFKTHINPFGIIFNPVSLAESLRKLAKKELFTEKDLYFYNNKWLSFYHHGSFANESPEQILAIINQGIIAGHEFLKSCSHLFLTFGTARVYELKSTNKIVANCHKIPQQEFSKRILSVNEIVNDFSELFQDLSRVNKKLIICFTLSPVRHWRDGAIENQLSKSTLHVAIQEIIRNYPQSMVYFPAYEVVMDDLRDYRFYEADMIHPNAQAVNYIWEKFREAYIDKKEFGLMEKIYKLNSAMQHRALNPDSEQHKKFMEQQLQITLQLQDQNPQLDLIKEINFFSNGK